MTDKEFIDQLTPLEAKMNQYAATSKVTLLANDIQLLVTLYPELQLRAAGQLPQIFNTGCSECIKQVFSTYISYYQRVQPTIKK